MTKEAANRSRARRLLQVGISGLAVVFIVRNVDLAATGRILAAADPGRVALAVLLYVLGQALSAYRWRLIGTALDLLVSFRHYVQFYFTAMFFMFFGPSTLGGDLVRGLYLAEATGHRARAFNSVLFDRLNGLVVLIAIGAVAFLIAPDYGLVPVLFWTTVALGVGLVGGWWLAPVLVRLVLPTGNRLRRFVEEDLGALWLDRRMLVTISLVSTVFHLLQIAILVLVASALGIDVPFSYVCIFHPLVSALSAIPISLSGIGLREGGYLYFLTHIGVDPASGAAFGGLWLFVLVANSLIGGLVFLATGARLPTLRSAPDLRPEERESA